MHSMDFRKSSWNLRKGGCMKSILGAFFLVMLLGCNNDDVLTRLSASLGGGKDKPRPEKTCRRCGTEMSKNRKCLNMTCPFNSILQQELCEQERTAARLINTSYVGLSEQERSEPVEKYRAKDMSSRPWGTHWSCRGCNKPTTCWVASVTVGGKTYKGPFMCCPECEAQLVRMVEYAKERDSRR